MAEIAAVLKGCTQLSPIDFSIGDHPLSQGPQEPALQGGALNSQRSSDNLLLSGGNSSASVACASDTLQHRLDGQIASGQHAKGKHKSENEEGRFAKKLQEFQKGTDMLRHQISLS